MKQLTIALSLIALFVGMGNPSQAQKFEAEEISVELQGPNFNRTQTLAIDGLRGRYFLSNTSALRANLDINFNSRSTINQQAQGSQKELESTRSSFFIDFRPGYEFHLSGTDRLSPYFGAELPVVHGSQTSKTERQVGTNVEERTTNEGFVRIGLNGVAGADYYFAEKLYLGVEVNLGFRYTINTDIEVKDTEPGVNPNDQKRGDSYGLSTGTIGTFRLGYVFGGNSEE